MILCIRTGLVVPVFASFQPLFAVAGLIESDALFYCFCFSIKRNTANLLFIMYADDIKLNKIDNHVVWSDEDIGPNAREFVEYCMGGFQYSCNSIISNNTFKVTNCDRF